MTATKIKETCSYIIIHQKEIKKKAYNTCCSQAVTRPSTWQAQHCLTSVIRREPVHSVWYGRRHQYQYFHILLNQIHSIQLTYVMSMIEICITIIYTQHVIIMLIRMVVYYHGEKRNFLGLRRRIFCSGNLLFAFPRPNS